MYTWWSGCVKGAPFLVFVIGMQFTRALVVVGYTIGFS